MAVGAQGYNYVLTSWIQLVYFVFFFFLFHSLWIVEFYYVAISSTIFAQCVCVSIYTLVFFLRFLVCWDRAGRGSVQRQTNKIKFHRKSWETFCCHELNSYLILYSVDMFIVIMMAGAVTNAQILLDYTLSAKQCYES